MKNYMVFDMDKPEDKWCFRRAEQGEQCFFALRDLDQMLRINSKYDGNEAAGKIRKDLFNILKDRGIDLDDDI